MQKINIGIVGYSNNFNKFLKSVNSSNSYYKLKFLIKTENINKINKDQNIIKLIDNNSIKFLVICNKSYKKNLINNIDYFIKKKITIVQASTNYEIMNHGFIIQKLFKDFSFEDIFLRKTLKLKLNEVQKNFFKKTILITGGAGSIGSYLVKNILRFKINKIYVIDNNEYNIFRLKNSFINNDFKRKVEFKILNIENKKNLQEYLKIIKPDIVFHTAALKHVNFLEENSNQGLTTNFIGTRNVISASNNARVKYFIHVSTDKATNPINNLGITKSLSELICQKYSKYTNMKIGIVRFGNVFDSFGSVSEIFKNKILNAQKINISHPNVKRFFMSKDEAANLLINVFQLLIKDKTKNNCRTFVYDMGKPIKILDLAKKIIFLSGRPTTKYLSNKFYGLKKNEKISERLVATNEEKINILDNGIFEIKKKKNILKKINFQTIQKTISLNNDKKSSILLRNLRTILNK